MQVNFVVDFVPILLTKYGFSVFWSKFDRFRQFFYLFLAKTIDSQVHLNDILKAA